MKDDFSILVSKVLSGEATEEDKILLRELLAENETNKWLYNQIKEYWKSRVVLNEEVSADFEKQLYDKIDRKRGIRRVGRKFSYEFYKIACILLLCLTVGISLYYNFRPSSHLFTYATQNSKADYRLRDGSYVKLNKNSSITLSSDFGDKNRRVDLKGEAYFDVRKDKGKTFTVHSSGTETTVLGTAFDIKADEVRRKVTVSLLRGSIHFKARKCEVLLKPQEELVYCLSTGGYTKNTTDLQYNTAWVSGRYVYTDISFGDFVRKLENIYKVKIDVSDPQILKRDISASFIVGQSVNEILSALEDELEFRYTMIDSNTINIIKR